MCERQGKWLKLIGVGVLMWAAAGAWAQEETTAPPSMPGPFQWLSGDLIRLALGIAGIVALVLVIVWMLMRQRPEPRVGTIEPEVEGSKFEQLLAEIQGLMLRIGGGESKGSYRKVDRLARIFLERTGHPGARDMNNEEIQSILRGGTFSPEQASALMSIFERCQRGGEREGEKLEFTAVDLLKDLKALIRQVEAGTSHKAP